MNLKTPHFIIELILLTNDATAKYILVHCIYTYKGGYRKMIRIGVVISHRAYERVKSAEPVHDEKYEIIYYKYDDISEAENICIKNID